MNWEEVGAIGQVLGSIAVFAYQSPLGALWYNSQKPRLDPDAVRYIDNLLAQPQ